MIFLVINFTFVNLYGPSEYQPRQNFFFHIKAVCFAKQFEVLISWATDMFRSLTDHACRIKSFAIHHPECQCYIKVSNIYAIKYCRLANRREIITIGTFPHIFVVNVLTVVQLHWVNKTRGTHSAPMYESMLSHSVQNLDKRFLQ